MAHETRAVPIPTRRDIPTEATMPEKEQERPQVIYACENCQKLDTELRIQAEQIRLMTFALQLTKKKLSLQVPVRREEHEVGYTEIDPDTVTILAEAIDDALDAARQEGGE